MEKLDHRARVTRMLLRRAFTDLLKEKPIESISVKELCAVAGINRGTFYSHYQDLYDLRRQLEEELVEDLQRALAPLLENAPSPLEVTEGIFRCLRDNADVCTVVLGPCGDRGFVRRLLEGARASYLAGYTRYFAGASQRQLDYFYAFVSAGCIGLLERWLSEGMTTPAEEIAAAAEGIMLRGVGFLETEKG